MDELASVIKTEFDKGKPGSPARTRIIEALLRMQLAATDRNVIPASGAEDPSHFTDEELKEATRFLMGGDD